MKTRTDRPSVSAPSFIALLFGLTVSVFGQSADEFVRIDIVADVPLAMGECFRSGKMSHYTWEPEAERTKKIAAEFGALGEWTKVSFSFTPASDGSCLLMLLGPYIKKADGSLAVVHMLFDDITADGMDIQNGDFENIAGWQFRGDGDDKARIIDAADTVHGGKQCARAWQNGRIQQDRIKLKAGRQVTISAWVRLAQTKKAETSSAAVLMSQLPVRMAGNTFTAGDKSLSLANGHLSYSVKGIEIFDCLPIWGNFEGKSSYGEIGAGNITNVTVDADKKEHTLAGVIKYNNTVYATYSLTVGLTESGTIRYRMKLTKVRVEDFELRTILVKFGGATLTGRKFSDGPSGFSIDKAALPMRQMKSAAVTFFSDEPDYHIAISDERNAIRQLKDARASASPRMEYWINFDKDLEAAFTLDISVARIGAVSMAENRFDPGGFERINLARLPNYGISRNLIQNPGFEAGFHGWEIKGGSRITDPDYAEKQIALDSGNAWQGKQSVRLEIRPSDPSYYSFINMIAPYAYQCIAGKPYTVSLYARSDDDAAVSVMAVSKEWGKWHHTERFPLTRDWKRYTATFTPKESLTALYLGVPWYDKATYLALKRPTHIWLDAVQFEEAPQASDFTTRTIAVSCDRTRSTMYRSEKKRLTVDIINSGPQARITARVTIRDSYRNTLIEKEYRALDLPAAGTRTLEPDAGTTMDYIGIYTIDVTLSADGHEDHDTFRIAVIEPFSTERLRATKHSMMFGLGTVLPGSGDYVRSTQRLRELGVGALENGYMNPLDKADYQRITGEGITVITGIAGDTDARFPWLKELRNEHDVHGERIQKALELFPSYFRTFSHHRYWKYLNEPERIYDREHICNPVYHVPFMSNVYQLLKKEIPDALLISSDPANSFEDGRTWLDRMLAAGGGKYIDILAIHPYRDRPERPDLDRDSQELIALADKHGFKGELWYTEGGDFPLYSLPSAGVSPSRVLSGDGVRFPLFTEDILGRRTGTALHLRTILTCLKYSERIRMFLNWDWQLSFFTLDVLKQQPREIGVGYNAYANLLGNARYVKDFSFEDSVRTYLFDDGTGKAVAAVWDFDARLENGERAPYVFELADASKASVIDTFGRPYRTVRAGSKAVFDIDYMPLFITANSVAELDAVLAKSRIRYSGADELSIAQTFPCADHMNVTVRCKGDPVSGTLQTTVNGSTQRSAISVTPGTDTTTAVDIGAADKNELRRVYTSMITVSDAAGIKKADVSNVHSVIACQKRTSPLVIDGDLSDWDGYRSSVIGGNADDRIDYRSNAYSGSGDLTAKLYAAWDTDNLYLALKVKDDVQCQPLSGKDLWGGDSLQLFFDVFKDATEQNVNTQDDYIYSVAKTASGIEVFRQLTPAWQMSFIENMIFEKNIPAAVIRDENRKMTMYEMQIPRKYLSPLVLKDGGIFGFGIIINDADDPSLGKYPRDSALSTSLGREMFQRQHVLSWCILEQ